MTPTSSHERTTQVLRENADALHESGLVLHQSAEAAPEQEATQRLHDLGDAVTTEAHTIEDRVGRLNGHASP